MNWIEQLTGWNLDGGSGWLEIALAALLLLALVAILWPRRRRAVPLGISIGFETEDVIVSGSTSAMTERKGVEITALRPASLSLVKLPKKPLREAWARGKGRTAPPPITNER